MYFFTSHSILVALLGGALQTLVQVGARARLSALKPKAGAQGHLSLTNRSTIATKKNFKACAREAPELEYLLHYYCTTTNVTR